MEPKQTSCNENLILLVPPSSFYQGGDFLGYFVSPIFCAHKCSHWTSFLAYWAKLRISPYHLLSPSRSRIPTSHHRLAQSRSFLHSPIPPRVLPLPSTFQIKSLVIGHVDMGRSARLLRPSPLSMESHVGACFDKYFEVSWRGRKTREV